MKTIAISILLILCNTSLPGQDSENVFPDGSKWYFFELSGGIASPPQYRYYTISISGDTLINDSAYRKIITTETVITSPEISRSEEMIYLGAIREDIQNKVIYYLSPSGSEEQLLYDFNWEIGDTVKGRLALGFGTPDTIVKIDSVLVGSQYRKRWTINEGYDIQLIEGIGSTYGLIEPSPGDILDNSSIQLTCYQVANTPVYPEGINACELPSSINEYSKEYTETKVFPNPSNGTFTIEFGNTQIDKLKVTNLLGKTILIKNTSGMAEISLSGLSKGIYILHMIDNNNYIITQKVICNP